MPASCPLGAASSGRAMAGRRERRPARPGPQPRAAARRTLAAEPGEHGENPPFPRRPAPGLEPRLFRGGTRAWGCGPRCRKVPVGPGQQNSPCPARSRLPRQACSARSPRPRSRPQAPARAEPVPPLASDRPGRLRPRGRREALPPPHVAPVAETARTTSGGAVASGSACDASGPPRWNAAPPRLLPPTATLGAETASGVSRPTRATPAGPALAVPEYAAAEGFSPAARGTPRARKRSGSRAAGKPEHGDRGGENRAGARPGGGRPAHRWQARHCAPFAADRAAPSDRRTG